ncbi:MAG: hypothetical protein AABO58_01135 [Acidobacteriota bacterium]
MEITTVVAGDRVSQLSFLLRYVVFGRMKSSPGSERPAARIDGNKRHLPIRKPLLHGVVRLAAVPATVLLVILLAACADQRESLVKEHLKQQIAEQSSGALLLSSLRKTNGYDQDLGGMKLYTLEWEARLAVQTDAWKAAWSDFSVLAAPPSAFESAVFGVTPRQLNKGATVLLGESKLQNTEQGWRVVDSNVKASRIDAPS